MQRAVLLILFGLVAASCGSSSSATVATPTVVEATLAPPHSTTVAPAPPTEAATESSTTTAPAPSEPPAGEAVTSTIPLRGLNLTEIATVSFPVAFANAPGDERLFIVDKTGVVVAVDPGGASSIYLDLRSLVSGALEQGLLGLAFAPDFESSRRLFVYYTDVAGDSVVAEYIDDGDVRTERAKILEVSQPASNHNGGSLLFDEAGRLYVGLGDGGAANDRFGNGQDADTLLGSILRLDVGDSVVPAEGNPYLDGGGAPENWAIGVRNPWRLSIDGDVMIVPDVGQNQYEEISVVPLNHPQPNLGWPWFEGLHCFQASSGCDDDGLIQPLVEVPHGDAGSCSITGGVVYRGAAIPEWTGRYFYSDYCGGYLRSVLLDGGSASDHVDWTGELGGPLGQVVVIGTDQRGELLIGLNSGKVYRVDPVR